MFLLVLFATNPSEDNHMDSMRAGILETYILDENNIEPGEILIEPAIVVDNVYSNYHIFSIGYNKYTFKIKTIGFLGYVKKI